MPLPLWETHAKLLHVCYNTPTQLLYLLTNIIYELAGPTQMWDSDEGESTTPQLLPLKCVLTDVCEFIWPRGSSSYLGESCKARNQRTLWVGRWPAVALRPHLIFRSSTVCVFSPKKDQGKKNVLETVVSDRFSLGSKVRALVLREVIFFFPIYPKSPGMYGWSLKVGETASRCTLMGISVAEICGIEVTSPDSYSLLSSPRLPAGLGLRPSVWVTPPSHTAPVQYTPFLQLLLSWSAGRPHRCCVSMHAEMNMWVVE